MRLTLPSFLVFALSALPAAAEPPRAVERMVQAHRLMLIGAAERDGLTQIAAARLAAGVVLQRVERAPEVAGKPAKADDLRPGPRETGALLEEARMAVEADETLGILLAGLDGTLSVLPQASVTASAAALAPGESHHYKLALEGGSLRGIGVLGDGDSALSLRISGANDDALMCQTAALDGLLACEIALPESGFVQVHLENQGPGINNYMLLTD